MTNSSKKILMMRDMEKDQVFRQKLQRVRNRNAAGAPLKIGDKLTDGTIYAGISPDTGQPLYAAPSDSPVHMTYKSAAEFAKNLEVEGKKGFRLPTRGELTHLFNNRDKGALKGTFDHITYYWSSTPPDAANTDGHRFSQSNPTEFLQYFAATARCVR